MTTTHASIGKGRQSPEQMRTTITSVLELADETAALVKDGETMLLDQISLRIDGHPDAPWKHVQFSFYVRAER